MANNISALTELRPLLSPDATVVLRDDSNFASLTSRWREWHAPEIAAVVEVVTEKDVQEVVSVHNLHVFVWVSC